MRRVIDKKTAIRAAILIFALISILSVFPFRLWSNTLQTSGGGEIINEEAVINVEDSLKQKFVSQYDRISSIDVYLNQMEKGRYISLSIMDKNQVVRMEAFVDTQAVQIPGYVNVPLEFDVEVGEDYYILLEGCRSKYHVAYENVSSEAAYIGNLYYKDNEVEGRHLATRINYRLPLDKVFSVKLIAVIAILAALLYVGAGMYYGRFSARNSLVTVRTAVKTIANPLIVLVFGTLMLMVFPLRIFDIRALDIIFYEIGILITAGIFLYAVNHKVIRHQIGVSFWDTVENKNKVIYVLIMFSMSMAIWYACEYMNGLYDIYHTMSERKMLIWLFIMMILTFSKNEVINLPNIVWIILSAVFGVRYYYQNLLPDTEKEYDLHNAILKYGVIIAVLAGALAINLIKLLIGRIKNRKEKSNIKISFYGVMVLIFFASIVVFRNTRWWGVVLAVTFTCLYIRIAVWEHRKDWIKIVSGGLMINFAISLIYSLLHRYFAGYVSGRFGFLFHTVTVTAEYFTFMAAALSVLLMAKIVALPKGIGIKEVFFSAWKEIVLFGWACAYAIFTVSRTAYLAIGLCIFIGVIVVALTYKKQFLRIVGAMALAVIICFPAAFTMQRIIPVMVARPVFYPIDDADEFIRGGADWGNANFMCVERFVNLFSYKILGMDISDYKFPNDYYNYDLSTGDPYLDIYGNPFEDSDEQQMKYGYSIISDGQMLASASLTRAELSMLMLLDEMNEYVDSSNALDVISNGRITIFKSYLKELNMTGHDDMGAELPNGEIALHAHNTYMQVAFDHGIFVGVLFILIIAGGLAAGISFYKKSREHEPLALLPFAIIIGFAVAGISEWVFAFTNPMTLALMVSIAPLMFREAKNEK